MLNPVLRHVLRPRFPKVTLLGTANSTSNLGTYTFSAMAIGRFGTGHPFDARDATFPGDVPLLAGTGRKAIAVIVHTEDDATVFDISSVSIGGVNGTERVDAAAASVAVSTAIYVWNPLDLIGIANTDVVVTASEALTSCAVGVVEISNIRSFVPPASGATSNESNDLSISTIAAHEEQIGGVVLLGSTCATGGGTEIPNFETNPANNSHDAFRSTLLYSENNAEIDFAAAYYIFPTVFLHDAGARFTCKFSWSGAGNSSHAGLYFI